MAEARIQLPKKFDLESVFRFAQELDYYAYHHRLVLVFPDPPFIAPFTMLFVSSKLKWLRERNPDLHLECEGHEEYKYAAHCGFFRHLGFEYGRGVGEAWGGDNYVPITELKRSSLYESKNDEIFELADLVQRHADKLALMIARDDQRNKDLYDVLSYSIREVMRNVFEHSQSDRLYYCAQYWPASHRVEFAVADFGIGIRRGLSENPNFRFDADKDAIEYSLLPSVSGKTHLARRSEVWFNSGYGLYMTSRLARNGGNFVIASGTTAIHLSRRTKHNYKTSFPGTVLRFNMDIDEIGNVSKRLHEFREEGAEIAKKIAGSGNRPPSAMSLLLRRDFLNTSR